MDKTEYYKELNNYLALTFNISARAVQYIRINSIMFNRTRKHIALHLAERVATMEQVPEWRVDALKFLASCSDKDWLFITSKHIDFDYEYK